MLSIGTLMAYTAVVVCVLILRYRPTGYRKMGSVQSSHSSLEDERCNRNSHEETNGLWQLLLLFLVSLIGLLSKGFFLILKFSFHVRIFLLKNKKQQQQNKNLS